jgi:hypothetical protein
MMAQMKSRLIENGAIDVENDILLSRQQVAARWAVSLATVKRREAAGVLHALRFSRRQLRFRLTEVVAAERAAEAR